MKVRRIEASKHKSAQFANLFFSLLEENNRGQKVYASFKYELHLVEGFRANILIENNILAPKSFLFNVKLDHVVVKSYEVKINIRTRQKDHCPRRKLFVESDGIVSQCFEEMVFLLLVPLLDSRDFLFCPAAQANLTLFAHIIEYEITKVLVRNTSNCPLRISCRQRVDYAIEICYNNYFFAKAEFVLHAVTISSKASLFFEHESSYILIPTNLFIETRLNNGVRLYGDEQAVVLRTHLIAKYLTIWESEGFVWIPPEHWMKVLFKPGWKAKVSAIKPRIYLVRNKARQLVDETFDKKLCFCHIIFTITHTPSSFPILLSGQLMLRAKEMGER